MSRPPATSRLNRTSGWPCSSKPDAANVKFAPETWSLALSRACSVFSALRRKIKRPPRCCSSRLDVRHLLQVDVGPYRPDLIAARPANLIRVRRLRGLGQDGVIVAPQQLRQLALVDRDAKFQKAGVLDPLLDRLDLERRRVRNDDLDLVLAEAANDDFLLAAGVDSQVQRPDQAFHVVRVEFLVEQRLRPLLIDLIDQHHAPLEVDAVFHLIHRHDGDRRDQNEQHNRQPPAQLGHAKLFGEQLPRHQGNHDHGQRDRNRNEYVRVTRLELEEREPAALIAVHDLERLLRHIFFGRRTVLKFRPRQFTALVGVQPLKNLLPLRQSRRGPFFLFFRLFLRRFCGLLLGRLLGGRFRLRRLGRRFFGRFGGRADLRRLALGSVEPVPIWPLPLTSSHPRATFSWPRQPPPRPPSIRPWTRLSIRPSTRRPASAPCCPFSGPAPTRSPEPQN